MPISSDVIRGYIDTIILSQLYQGDNYGYEINKNVRRLTNNRFEIKEATLYTAFRRLEESGYICSYWGPTDSGARRRYYVISDRGREQYLQQLQNWREAQDILNRLLETGGDGHAEET